MRDTPGDAICEQYHSFTAEAFSDPNGLPVLICTHNEEFDVPLTLLALARSTRKLRPQVVDNSTDRTAALAARMGARVIKEQERGQMKAYQTGLSVASHDFPDQPILMTDADTLPTKRWAETMFARTAFPGDIGGIACGRVVFDSGPSTPADLTRSIYAVVGDTTRYMFGQKLRARSTNSLVRLGHGMLEAIQSQDPMAFPCDAVLADVIKGEGGYARSILEGNALVFTRGDRFVSIKDLAQAWRRNPIEQYGDHGLVPPKDT